MMQYDVKAAYVDADGAMVAYPVRIKGAYVSVTTGGTNPVIFTTTLLRRRGQSCSNWA